MMDTEDRLAGRLYITVIRVDNLHKVTERGIMDPYIQISLNQDKQHTKTITDGGQSVEFGDKLTFNIDCQKQDLLIIKAKHKTTFSSTTIGVFSIKMIDFLNVQKRKLKFQLVDEKHFEPRGTIELFADYHGTNDPVPDIEVNGQPTIIAGGTLPTGRSNSAVGPSSGTISPGYGSAGTSPIQSPQRLSPIPPQFNASGKLMSPTPVFLSPNEQLVAPPLVAAAGGQRPPIPQRPSFELQQPPSQNPYAQPPQNPYAQNPYASQPQQQQQQQQPLQQAPQQPIYVAQQQAPPQYQPAMQQNYPVYQPPVYQPQQYQPTQYGSGAGQPQQQQPPNYSVYHPPAQMLPPVVSSTFALQTKQAHL